MYVYKGEMIGAAIIFGILWAIIPWDDVLSTYEMVMTSGTMLMVSFGIVAVIEQILGLDLK